MNGCARHADALNSSFQAARALTREDWEAPSSYKGMLWRDTDRGVNLMLKVERIAPAHLLREMLWLPGIRRASDV